MAKFRVSATVLGIAASAVFATQAFAIGNEAECSAEGGTMVNVKNSDYCLVPIRDEAYADPVYDGNQLGVTECPGDKLNDGVYCMYPVTIRPQITEAAPVEPAVVTESEAPEVEAEAETPTIVDQVVDEVVEEAVDQAGNAAEKAIESAIK